MAASGAAVTAQNRLKVSMRTNNTAYKRKETRTGSTDPKATAFPDEIP
jgi:hypothetical protein